MKDHVLISQYGEGHSVFEGPFDVLRAVCRAVIKLDEKLNPPEMGPGILRQATEDEEALRAEAMKWIDDNFGLLSGKSSATDRMIECFMAGAGLKR